MQNDEIGHQENVTRDVSLPREPQNFVLENAKNKLAATDTVARDFIFL